MITDRELDNAIDIAKEEILDPERISKGDIDDFKKRLNGLLDKLREEAEED